MQKLLLLLFLSLGFIGNSYADVMICKDNNDHSTCTAPSSPSDMADIWYCNEGYVKSDDERSCVSLSSSIDIGKLSVTLTGGYKVEIHKEGEHKFTYNCQHHFICEIYSISKADPEYEISDGSVQASKDLMPLLADNIKKTHDGQLRFFVVLSSASGAWQELKQYAVDVVSGGVEELSSGRSYYKYGMNKPSGDESCVNIFLC